MVNNQLLQNTNKPFMLQDLLNSIGSTRFQFLSEGRKFDKASLLPKYSRFYKVKVDGINQRSFLIEVYRSELMSVYEKVGPRLPPLTVPD